MAKTPFFLLPVAVLCLLGAWMASPAQAATEHTLTGKTMGTYFRIKFIAKDRVSPALWEKKVKVRLAEVNGRLSMFQKDSELSRFNLSPAGQPFRLSRDFEAVLSQCRQIHGLSQGAWDGTVKPLVDLWGFGTREAPRDLPDPARIARALEQVGFDKLVLEGLTLTKTVAGLTLDLGSIAKGYGVDEIARLFLEAGIEDCLVEIGGELAGFGRNKHGKPWAVGISNPIKTQIDPGLYGAVILDNRAIATSGNYRNFFEIKGKTYSHIIHPATGYPVDNQVVSASVVAATCTLADGLATALMVMETGQALDMINAMDQVECLIIQKQGETLVPFRSRGFAALELERH